MYVFAKCAAKVRFFPETAKLSSDYFSFSTEKSPSSPQTDCPAPAFYIKFGRKMVLAGRAMEHNMLAYVFSHVRNQFITCEKKGSDEWRFDGTLFMHRPNSRDFTRNLPRICHIYHNLQQICHTYILLYIITIMHVCGRLADFSGKNSY